MTWKYAQIRHLVCCVHHGRDDQRRASVPRYIEVMFLFQAFHHCPTTFVLPGIGEGDIDETNIVEQMKILVQIFGPPSPDFLAKYATANSAKYIAKLVEANIDIGLQLAVSDRIKTANEHFKHALLEMLVFGALQSGIIIIHVISDVVFTTDPFERMSAEDVLGEMAFVGVRHPDWEPVCGPIDSSFEDLPEENAKSLEEWRDMILGEIAIFQLHHGLN